VTNNQIETLKKHLKDLPIKSEEMKASWEISVTQMSTAMEEANKALANEQEIRKQQSNTLSQEKEQSDKLKANYQTLVEENQRNLEQSLENEKKMKLLLEDQRKLKLENKRLKEAWEKANQDTRAQVEYLSKYLEIFKQHGLSPQERAFWEILEDMKRSFEHYQLQAPRIFISYAWESNMDSNEHLQQWLGRFASSLEKLGSKLFFDLYDMGGELTETMRRNINQSNCFIVICTPHWKQRILTGLTPSLEDCIENNRFVELETKLKSLGTDQQDSNFVPANNAAFEFLNIWAKVKKQPNSNTLIFLHFRGTFEEAVLPQAKQYLIRTVTQHTDEERFEVLFSLSRPLGIIPSLFGLRNDGLGYCLRAYEANLEKYKMKMKNIAKMFSKEYCNLQ